MKHAHLSVNCNCKHPFQDRLYGTRVRVATPHLKGEARCTVCGTLSRHFMGEHKAIKGKKTGSGTGGAKSYFAIPPAIGWSGGEPIANGWKPVA